jgi:hypothetical protein
MRALSFIMGIVALISAQAASAQLLYQSTPDLTAAPAFQTCSPCDPTQVAGSKFSLGAAASVGTIQFVTGSYGWGWYGPTDVQVSIYRDVAGNWGGTVGDQLYTHNFTSYTESGIDGGYHLLGFDTSGLTLDAGTYLIFFTNTSILAPAVYGGGSMFYAWPDDDGGLFTGFEYSPSDGYSEGFALLGPEAVTPSPTPEPASWMLMVAGFGLAGYGLRSRRAALRRA